ncbi:MAG: O-antigen ligase family protein [bacterium]
METSSKILLWVIRVCAVLAFLVPIINTGNTFYSNIFVQSSLFQILVEIMVAAWLLLMIFDKNYRPDFKNKIFVALVIFAGALTLAQIFSVDVKQSLWSLPTRMMGLVNLVHYWLWFMVLFSVFKTWVSWRWLFITSGVVSIGAASYGYFQAAYSLTIDGRIFSTLTNPTYLGLYALLHIFIVILVYVKETDLRLRILCALTVIANLAALILTGSRGPLVALIISALVLVIAYPIISGFGRKKMAICCFAIAIISLAFIALASKTLLFSRIAGSGFAEDRITVWKIALDGIKSKPISGYGIGNFDAVFNRLCAPGEKSVNDFWYTDSHNIFLDILVAGGAFSLLAYLALLFVIITSLVKIYKTQILEKKKTALVILCIFLAYLIQGLFLFEIASGAMIFYAVLAFLAVQAGDDVQNREGLNNRSFSYPILCIIIIALVSAIYFINILPMMQTYEHRKAYSLLLIDPKESTRLFKNSLRTDSFANTALRVNMSEVIAYVFDRSLGVPAERRELILFATREIEKAAEEHPGNYRYQLFAAYANRMASGYEPERLAKSETIAARGILLALKRPELRLELAESLTAEKRYEEASAEFNRALMTADKNSLGLIYFRRGIMDLAVRRFDLAESDLRNAESAGYQIYYDIAFGRKLVEVRGGVRISQYFEEYLNVLKNIFPNAGL